MKSRAIWAVILVAVAAAAAFWGVRDEEPPVTLAEARAMHNPLSASPENLAAAKRLFAEKCAHCHGATGRGDGPDAVLYSIKPADLTSPMIEMIPEGELFYKISEGRKPMPAFRRQLRREQRWQLVHYVQSLAQAEHGN
jgi:mono/diheme cytochrome c family protein